MHLFSFFFVATNENRFFSKTEYNRIQKKNISKENGNFLSWQIDYRWTPTIVCNKTLALFFLAQTSQPAGRNGGPTMEFPVSQKHPFSPDTNWLPRQTACDIIYSITQHITSHKSPICTAANFCRNISHRFFVSECVCMFLVEYVSDVWLPNW